MITRRAYWDAQKRAIEALRRSGLSFTKQELERIEVADFGMNDLNREGAQMLMLVQTGRLSVKLLVLFPQQTVPEHWHPPIGKDPGKEETIRVLSGVLYLYVPGVVNLKQDRIPKGKASFYTSTKGMIMRENDQLTLKPGTKHWFQAGAEGAVLFSLSTATRDLLDKFSDPNVVRITKIDE